jgi:hypothetical protein
VRQTADGPGACSGTLTLGDGTTRQIDAARSAYHAISTGQVSCLASTATGAGWLSIGERRLRFTMSETRAAAAGTVTLNGRRSGTLEAAIAAGGDPVKIVQSCNGTGLTRADVTASGTTLGAFG